MNGEASPCTGTLTLERSTVHSFSRSSEPNLIVIGAENGKKWGGKSVPLNRSQLNLVELIRFKAAYKSRDTTKGTNQGRIGPSKVRCFCERNPKKLPHFP